jgi:hypothetical protein
MDPFENPYEEMLPVEDAVIPSGAETLSTSESESQEEIMDLIFPEDRRVSVTIYAYVLRQSGKSVIKAIRDRVTPEYVSAGLTEYEFRSSWTVPTASQMDEYREECSEYNRMSGSMLANNLAIRDLIVANHLKELLLPPKYKSFPLKYARPDRLSGDTVKQLKLMHSGIYDLLYTEFISESCLIV